VPGRVFLQRSSIHRQLIVWDRVGLQVLLTLHGRRKLGNLSISKDLICRNNPTFLLTQAIIIHLPRDGLRVQQLTNRK